MESRGMRNSPVSEDERKARVLRYKLRNREEKLHDGSLGLAAV
jgi:hypothetical protein